MSASVIQLRGCSFITGLFWQPLNGADPKREKPSLFKKAGSYISEMSEDLGADYLAWHDDPLYPQVGFVSSVDMEGNKPDSLVSLGLTVLKAVHKKFPDDADIACLFELDDGQWYYYSQKEFLIMPGADIIDSKSAVVERIFSEIAEMGFSKVIAPQEFGIDGSLVLTLDDLLGTDKSGNLRVHKSAHLISVKSNPKKIIIPALIFLCFIGGSIAGYKYYDGLQKAKAEAERQARLRALAAQQVIVPREAPPDPWPEMMSAESFINSCMSMFLDNPVSVGLWTLSDFVCNGNQSQASWTALAGGWASHFQATYPMAEFSPTLQRATVSFDSLIPAGYLDDKDVGDPDTVVFEMRKKAQHYGIMLSTSISVPPEDVLRPLPTDPLPREWTEINWSVNNLTLPPFEFVKVFGEPGFRVTLAKVNIVNGLHVWSLEGIQYAK